MKIENSENFCYIIQFIASYLPAFTKKILRILMYKFKYKINFAILKMMFI